MGSVSYTPHGLVLNALNFLLVSRHPKLFFSSPSSFNAVMISSPKRDGNILFIILAFFCWRLAEHAIKDPWQATRLVTFLAHWKIKGWVEVNDSLPLIKRKHVYSDCHTSSAPTTLLAQFPHNTSLLPSIHPSIPHPNSNNPHSHDSHNPQQSYQPPESAPSFERQFSPSL